MSGAKSDSLRRLVGRGPLWRAVFSPRNSTSTARLSDLLQDQWWMDTTFAPIYVHVPHLGTDGMEGTIHRVYPRTIKGRECRRIGMRNGKLYWLHDEPNAAVEARRNAVASDGLLAD